MTSHDYIGPDPTVPLYATWDTLTATQKRTEAAQTMLDAASQIIYSQAADYVENARRIEHENKALAQDAEHRANAAKVTLQREQDQWAEDRSKLEGRERALKERIKTLESDRELQKPKVGVDEQGVQYTFEPRETEGRGDGRRGVWRMEELQSLLTHLFVNGGTDDTHLAVSAEWITATVASPGTPPQVWERPRAKVETDPRSGATWEVEAPLYDKSGRYLKYALARARSVSFASGAVVGSIIASLGWGVLF